MIDSLERQKKANHNTDGIFIGLAMVFAGLLLLIRQFPTH